MKGCIQFFIFYRKEDKSDTRRSLKSMKKGNKISIVLYVVIIILAAFAFWFMQQSQVKPTKVYVWATSGNTTKIISMEDISELTIPADAVTDQMVIVGQQYVREDGSTGSVLNELILGKMVDTAVYAGEYVTPNALINPEDIDPFKTMDLSGYRKYALSTTPVDAIGGNLEAGDVVDLIITVRGTTMNENGKAESWTYSKVFMENVLIYKVLTSDGQDYIDYIEHDDALYSIPSTIILAVTPSQIEEIKARESLGNISFIGRFADSTDAESEGFSVVIGEDGIEFIPDNSFEIPY